MRKIWEKADKGTLSVCTVFAVLLIAGIFLSTGQKMPVENALTVSEAISISDTASTPFAVVDVEKDVMPPDPFAFTLNDLKVVSVEYAGVEAPVCQNGATDPIAPAPIAPAQPATIKTLPPEVAVGDDGPKTMPSDQAETTSDSANPANSTEWVPFVYFYQKSPCRMMPDRILCVFPTMETEKTADQTQQNAAPTAMVPFFYGPVYPVCQPTYPQPVYMPRMVPSRFGAPKLVYPNGVVVKPKVYVPGQPIKNTLRAVTP